MASSVRFLRIAAGFVLVLSVAALSGCAGRQATFAKRFVKPGEPAVNLDDAGPAPGAQRAAALGEYIRRLRTIQAQARTNVTLGTRLESTDPQLAQALLRLSMFPTAESHRIVAAAYLEAGVRDYAFKHLQQAVRLNSCDGAAIEGLARLWRDWGALEPALSEAHRAVYCDPASAGARNTLGTVLAALGQYRHAQQAFELALQLDGTAAFALNNLCYVSVQKGDGQAAERACQRALALDPTMVAARTNLALAYALQGDVARAEGRLMDSADAATALYNVGMLRMALSNYSDAAEAFELAATTRPSLTEAARRALIARGKAAQGEQ